MMRSYQPAKQKNKANPLIMRKTCGCGRPLGPTGECAECRRKKMGIQTKLRVNEPGDRYEQEADRLSEQVLRTSGPGQVTPLQTLSVQRSVEGEAASGNNEAEVRMGSGQPLHEPARRYFESRFGHDLSEVRIHDNDAAQRTANQLQANAFTIGSSIGFARGQYRPQSSDGRRLLAHEMVHVLQQRQASGDLIQRDDTPAPTPDAGTEKASPEFVERRDIVFSLADEDQFKAAAKLAGNNALYKEVETAEEMKAVLETIPFPIATLYIFSHSTPDASIKFSGTGYVSASDLAKTLKGAIPSGFQPNTVDFRGCSVGMDPSAMEEMRQALRAQSVIGSTCFIAFMGLPFTVNNVHIKERRQLRNATVKATWDKHIRTHPNKMASKACLLSTSTNEYFEAGGYFVSVYANKTLTKDYSPTDSVCFKDLTNETISPKDALTAKPTSTGTCKRIRVEEHVPEPVPEPTAPAPPAAEKEEEAE